MKRIVWIIVLLCFFILLFPIKVFSANSATRTESGMLVFETTDTKATSGIRWKTVGFTITRKKCLTGEDANGGYPKKLQNAVIYLKEEYKKEKPSSNGTVHVVFSIPEEVVTQALIKGGMGDVKDNDILYLHGIFQVTHSGKEFGSKKYDLPSIYSAEAWANPKDFKDHFDVEVKYEGAAAPVSIEYRTQSGEVISIQQLDKDKWVKTGEKAVVQFDTSKIFKGRTYTLGHSYYRLLNRPTKKYEMLYVKEVGISAVQNRTVKQQLKGVRFVAIMYKEKVADSLEAITGDLTEPKIEGCINADERGKERFEVEDGIPSGESIYGNVMATDYLTQYQFEKKAGVKNYKVTVEKTYHMTWENEEGNLEWGSQTIRETLVVEREYSYWQIKELNVYGLQNAILKNAVFSKGSITMQAKEPNHPKITYWHSSNENDHIEEPEYNRVIYKEAHLSGTNIPNENFQGICNQAVGQIKVKSDKLIFQGETIMSDAISMVNAPEPKEIPECDTLCHENLFFSSNNRIASGFANGGYPSEGIVTYEKLLGIHTVQPNIISYEISDVNSVVVHTPVVCDAKVNHNKEFNQMIKPDLSKASLILDMNFEIQFLTEGYHREIKGYGYRDYGKYIIGRQVKFPFDVYKGDLFLPKNTWVDITDDITSYYLPIWVQEGQYMIAYRSISINAAANDAYKQCEELANLNEENYVAIDYSEVEVSGRLYGLHLYDISDYPMWKQVFRRKDSMELTGFYYSVGTKNENGMVSKISSENTVPLVNGSHPLFPNQGMLKTGYVARFYLTTIGTMWGDKDYIKIKPTFYFVDINGKNRQEVDIYYTETFKDKKNTLVKIGSSLDRSNVKKLMTGDKWLSIPETELIRTAKLKDMSLKDWRMQISPVYTFDNIMIPKALRTYVGNVSIPASVDSKRAISSKQKWYGEYYLPGEIHIVSKDYNIADYVKQNRVNYREKFWLTKGYLIVNFEIETIKNGERYLSYQNVENAKNGYCNMWKKEGFVYQKMDNLGTTFSFVDGDFLMYYGEDTVQKDYLSGGTH